jgi:hypothetical protein
MEIYTIQIINTGMEAPWPMSHAPSIIGRNLVPILKTAS